MRFGSVCSGIEAASVAWGPLGFHAAFLSEIEPFPCAVLAHHYPGVPNRGDMTEFAEWPDEPIDLLVGGTPCQSFSVAGLRAGLADPRGNLMLTYLAIAAKFRPRWLVWENVPGVLSSNGGRDFGTLLRGLGELGYGFAYRVLDAQFCRAPGLPFAVPQRRRRVFVVGYLGDWRRAAAVLFDGASLRGDPAPRREAGKGVAPTISSRPTGGGGLGTDFDLDGGLVTEDVSDTLAVGANQTTGFPSPSMVASTGDVAHCLNAGGMGRQDYETETMVAHTLLAAGADASEDGTGRGLPLVVDTLVSNGDAHSGIRDERGLLALPINTQIATRHEALGEGTGFGIGDPGDPAFTLRSAHSHGVAIAFDTTQITSKGNYSAPKPGEPMHPLAAGAHPPAVAFNNTPSNSNKDYNAREASYAQALTSEGGAPSARGGDLVQNGWAVRRLTPRECERLQGFPDNYTAIPYRGKPAADGPRYKALGNSMAVNVMRVLGERIALVDATERVEVAA